MSGYMTAKIEGNLVYIYKYQYDPYQRRTRVSSRKGVRSLYSKYVRRYDNALRSTSRFERLVFNNVKIKGNPHLCTFTLVEKPIGNDARKRLSYVFRSLKRAYSRLSVIFISEYQKRGVVHYHCLIWGLPPKYHETERSLRCIQNLWLLGFVDLKPTYGSYSLARYLSKYMLKGVRYSPAKGERLYTLYGEIVRPVYLKGKTQVSYLGQFTGKKTLVRKVCYNTKWLGTCTKYIYTTNDYH